MTLRFIEKSYRFEKPGIASGEIVDMGGHIIEGQGTVVLRAITTKFNDNTDHSILNYSVKATNVKVRDRSIEYDVEFNFRDRDHPGSANIDVMVIADVDSN